MSPLVALLIAILFIVYWRVALALALAVILALIMLGMLTAVKSSQGSLYAANQTLHVAHMEVTAQAF